jgi:hypothetical protein
MLRVEWEDGDDDAEPHQVDEDGEEEDKERRALARHANV